MNAQRTAVAQRCLEGAHAGTIDFPSIVGTLIEAGFDGYFVDYRRNTTSYYRPDGDSVVLDNPGAAGPVAEAFDPAGVAGQVRWAQANPPDYSYEAFCKAVKTMGCAGYLVSFPGRRVLYIGRTGETHVERMP